MAQADSNPIKVRAPLKLDAANDESAPNDDALSPLVLPIERLQAAVRFIWRGAIGAACIWLAALIWPAPEHETIVYLSFLVCAVSIAFCGFILCLAALRWLALTLWPQPTFIRLTPQHIEIHAGPFGREAVNWHALNVELEGGLTAEIFVSLPDEALVPTLRRSQDGANLFGTLQTYSGQPAEHLAALIKPFVFERMMAQEADDHDEAASQP